MQYEHVHRKFKGVVLFAMRASLVFLALILTACAALQSPCEMQSFHGQDAMNIVFFQDGFTEPEFSAHAQSAMSAMLQKEPFVSKPYFNIYHVSNRNQDICMRGSPRPLIGAYARSPLHPFSCNVSAIEGMVNSCGIDRAKIIVLTNDTIVSQTAMSFDESAVMFLDMKNMPPEVIQHEFAHFFGLVDEEAQLYSHAIGPGRQPAPNCVETHGEAIKRWGDLYPQNHTFARGCAGSRNWYAPEEGTLMDRNPDPILGYGKFNTRYLARAMECCYARSADLACSDFFEEYPEWECT